MLKKLALLLGVDVVGLGLWIWTDQPSNDMAILGVVIPPVLLMANLLLVLLCLLLRQVEWRTAFLLNAAAAPLIYGWLLTRWFDYSLAHQYMTFSFAQGPHHYTLTIHKLDDGFDILERLSPGSSVELMTGTYRVQHDTTYLDDPDQHKRCLLYHGALYQFDHSPHPLPVQLTR